MEQSREVPYRLMFQPGITSPYHDLPATNSHSQGDALIDYLYVCASLNNVIHVMVVFMIVIIMVNIEGNVQK